MSGKFKQRSYVKANPTIKTGNTTGERLKQFASARERVVTKGLDPIDMLYEIYFLSRDRSQEVGDDTAASYLSVAGKAASDLAKYIYPTLSAIKIDQTVKNENAMTVKEAMKVIMEDPFTKSALSAMAFQDNKRALEADEKDRHAKEDIALLLPSGDSNEGKGLAETYKPKKIKLK